MRLQIKTSEDIRLDNRYDYNNNHNMKWISKDSLIEYIKVRTMLSENIELVKLLEEIVRSERKQ